MNPSTIDGLCRVTVVGSRRRADLALPTDVMVADLLAAVVQQVEGIPRSSAAPQAWVLQRLGENPLDPAATLETAGVRDGQQLFLRDRAAATPPAVFDDVVDAVATTVQSSRPWDWRATRGTALGLAAIAFVPLLWAALAAGPPWGAPATILLAVAATIGVGAVAVARALGDGAAGVALGAVACVLGAVGAGLLPGGDVSLTALGAPHLLAGAAGAATFAVLLGVGVSTGGHLFRGVGMVAVVAAVGGLLALVFTLEVAEVAALTTALLLATTPFVPRIAFLAGRLRVPDLPRSPTEFTDVDDDVPDTVASQAALADEVATDVLAAVSIGVVGCAPLLVAGEGTMPVVLAVMAGLVLLLRSRLFVARWARLSLLLGGAGTLAIVATGAVVAAGQTTGVAMGAVMAAVVAAVLVAFVARPDRQRISPFWGRAGELFEIALALAVIPVTLGVLGVYGWARGLAG